MGVMIGPVASQYLDIFGIIIFQKSSMNVIGFLGILFIKLSIIYLIFTVQ